MECQPAIHDKCHNRHNGRHAARTVPFKMPSAPRSFCVLEMNVVLPDFAVALTSTGQPALVAPVSTFTEKIMCFTVSPPSGVVIASKNSEREGRSTTGVPEMPRGLMLPQGSLESGIGTPALSTQMTLPLAASSA